MIVQTGRLPAAARSAPAALRPTWSLFGPFSLVVGFGVLSAFLPPHNRFQPGLLAAAAGVALLAAACFAISFRRPVRTWLDTAAALLLFPFLALLREAVGGASSGLSALVLVPTLWLALTGTRRELYVASLLAGAVFIAPLWYSPDGNPTGEWRRAVTWVAITLVFGPLLQRLVARLRCETDSARQATQELNRANHELTEATERALRLFEDAPHGVAAVDRAGLITNANGALREIAGATAGSLDNQPFVGLGRRAVEPLQHLLDQHLQHGDLSATGSAVLLDHQGNDVPVSLSSRLIRHEDPAEDFILINVVDVSEQRRYEERLAFLADHDVLTGLANRRLFESELERHLANCRRYGPAGAVLLFDLDNFKQVNDTLGHGAGDELIVDLAGVLLAEVRASDIVARLGGDEFAVLITQGGLVAARAVADKIVTRVREHAATLDGVRRRLTTSVGVVTFRAAAEHPIDILALADMTMYDAKEAGRDQFAVLEEGTHRAPRVGARLQWQARIEAALREDAFALHFQPIMDLSTDRIGSAEALIRLADSDELVPPTRFFYIAERAGLAPAVDAWVVRHAIADLARLRAVVPDFQLEVNLSGHSIGVPALEAAITESLAEHHVDPAALILEITETAAVSDVRTARAFAERMTGLGCQFALDDFGAGFGSFYYLKHLLFDYVKIDGEFVSNSHRSEVDRTIMRSIVGIANDLGKRTIAEFVSTTAALEVVRAERVNLAQGFLIGRPVPLDEFRRRHLDGGQPGAAGSGRDGLVS